MKEQINIIFSWVKELQDKMEDDPNYTENNHDHLMQSKLIDVLHLFGYRLKIKKKYVLLLEKVEE